MISQKLKQIDKRIVELLKERIALLNSESISSPKEEIAALTPLLTSIGISQEVWSELITNSTAKKAESPKSDRSRRVTIVGGKGRMGQFFAEQLTAAGHCVRSLGRQDWDKAQSFLGEAELVLISVPIEQTLEIIERTAQYLAPTTAIADITSIKTTPVEKMLACHDGAVMGLHPMFGPNKNSFDKQKIVVCSGRHNDSFQWLLDFMAERGGELIYCSPQEHDRLMAIVQAVRHFSQFGFGVFLNTERVDPKSSLSVASPNYRSEYEALERFFQQNPSMYVDIMLATETSCQTIERLVKTYQDIAELIAQKDRDALISIFANTKDLFIQPEFSTTSQAKPIVTTIGS
jgi:prephenate dehydrogenase/chorismate mutase/prephenate dehydrogenase